jgi:hypothetical protein
LTRLARTACSGVTAIRANARVPRIAHAHSHCDALPAAVRLAADSLGNLPDGTLVQRARLVDDGTTAVDLVAYASDGLIIGGIVCYQLDGQPHPAIIHVHGGTGGIFINADGDMLQTCWNWAALFGRTAFAPSLRGQDGGEGQLELCLGETDDVVAGATMMRGLEVTDPARLALVGGSVGGCIALGAGPRIPNLAAVVAFVPPTSWKDLVQYHETSWMPAVEEACDGEVVNWNIGGPPVAAVIDDVICGHSGCSDADYNARSPLALVGAQTAPTLIVSAQDDNLVPFDQQTLWSLFRQGLGHPLIVSAVNPCDPPTTPALAEDVHIVVLGGFHALAAGPISTGLLFLLGQLDAVVPGLTTALQDGTRSPAAVVAAVRGHR